MPLDGLIGKVWLKVIALPQGPFGRTCQLPHHLRTEMCVSPLHLSEQAVGSSSPNMLEQQCFEQAAYGCVAKDIATICLVSASETSLLSSTKGKPVKSFPGNDSVAPLDAFFSDYL